MGWWYEHVSYGVVSQYGGPERPPVLVIGLVFLIDVLGEMLVMVYLSYGVSGSLYPPTSVLTSLVCYDTYTLMVYSS